MDPLASSSDMLTPQVVGDRHYRVARRVRETLAHYEELKDLIVMLGVDELSRDDRKVVSRARRLERFLTQPTSRYTGKEGRRALAANFASALTVVPGGLVAWAAGARIDVTFLLPLAAGNFVYIAASDLVPEIKHADRLWERVVHVLSFLAGLGLLVGVRLVLA